MVPTPQRRTLDDLGRSVRIMHEHVNPKNDQPAPLVSDECFEIIMEVGGVIWGPRLGPREPRGPAMAMAGSNSGKLAQGRGPSRHRWR
jgi:hypothetical protein